jgi:hypothetical protein
MMNTDKATPELFAALAKAQAEVENATKGSTNPHFKSKYADLAEVLNTVRPTFAKHGLSLLQSTGFEGSLVSVETVIGHEGGGFISSIASCVPAKSDAQGIGAATTYLRRYGLAAMTGVAQEDDDGQSAAHAREPEPVRAREPEPVQARKSSAQAKREGEWQAFTSEVDACQSLEEIELLVVSRAWQESVRALPRAWVQQLQDYVQGARDVFLAPATGRAPVAPAASLDKLETH